MIAGFLDVGDDHLLRISVSVRAGLAESLGGPKPEHHVAPGNRLELEFFIEDEFAFKSFFAILQCAHGNPPGSRRLFGVNMGSHCTNQKGGNRSMSSFDGAVRIFGAETGLSARSADCNDADPCALIRDPWASEPAGQSGNVFG